MADMRAQLTVDLDGNVARQARQMDRAMSRFARSGKRHLSALGRGAQMAGRGIDRLGNRYTALITGAAGVGAAKSVIALEERFARLGVQSNATAEQMEALKKRIFEVAQQSDIRVSADQLISGVEKIVEKNGDLKLAGDNLRTIGLGISAAGSEGENLGGILADMRDKFRINTSEGLLKALDLLVRQGKLGSFILKDLSTQGERLSAAYAATGRTGADAVREMGALIQVFRKGTGSPEQATTAFEAILAALQDAEKIKLIKQGGIQLMDPKNPKVMRSVVDILKDIITKADGNVAIIGKIFGREGIRGLNDLIAEFKATGKLEGFDKFLKIVADGKQIAEDSATIAGTAAGAMRSLGTAFQKQADAKLTEPIQALAKAINDLDPKRVDDIMDSLAKGAMAAGGIIVATKALRGIAAVRGAFGRRGGAGSLASGTFTRPQPVMVVNWPPALGGSGAVGKNGGSVPVAGGRGRAGRVGRMGRLAQYGSRAGRFLGRAALPIYAGLGALTIASSAMDGDTKGAIRSGSSLAGGLAGAAAGSLMGPIGTVIGGIAGAFGGERIGDLLASLLDETKKTAAESGQQTVKTEGEIVMRFENAPNNLRVDSLNKKASDFDIKAEFNNPIAMDGPL